jgi:hypothetical protein
LSKERVYIPCSCDSGSEGAEEENEYIYLRPLMEELKELWQGVDAYDSHKKY